MGLLTRDVIVTAPGAGKAWIAASIDSLFFPQVPKARSVVKDRRHCRRKPATESAPYQVDQGQRPFRELAY
ncbi:MAG: hypothetical protein ABSH41_15195 [Syntrophobacteraceae bacterium]